MRTYKISRVEVSTHKVELTERQLADIKGLSPEELHEQWDSGDIDDGLADDLANLDDDGFYGLTREDIEVKAISIAHDEAHGEALRENWNRDRVKAAGFSYDTHFAKFDGTVTER